MSDKVLTKTCDQCGETFGLSWPWIHVTRAGTFGDAWDATLCMARCVKAFLDAKYAEAIAPEFRMTPIGRSPKR